MTRRNRFPLATLGLMSSLSPSRSAARSAASVLFGTPRGRGAALPLNLYLPPDGPLRVEWGGAATPEGFPPPASYPKACSAALARPARRASAAATPLPRSLPEPAEPRELGALRPPPPLRLYGPPPTPGTSSSGARASHAVPKSRPYTARAHC